jgi:hypothetical protein
MKTKMKHLLLLLCTISIEVLFAKEHNGTATPNTGKIMAGCQKSTSRAVLDVNNVRTTLLNGGDMWWDLDNARYEVPKTNDPFTPKKHSLFAGGIWLGGKDQPGGGGNLMMVTQTYRQDGHYSFWPGPIVQNAMDITPNECLQWDRHFTVNKKSIDKYKSLTEYPTTIDTTKIPFEIYNWPGRGNPYLSAVNDGMQGAVLTENLAPFYDRRGDCIYDPHDGDYPDIRGDQAIWWVMNDVGGVKSPVSNPIGLEMSVMAFAFASADDLNNMTFYKQKIINKGSKPVYETYVGQFADPDLGKYDDDYVQCDVSRGLGICYNGDDDDEGINGYGVNPPSIGIDFFSGPLADENDGIDNNRNGIIDEPGEKIIMSNFVYYNNNSDPVNGEPDLAIHFYNLLRSIWKNNTPIRYDGKDGKGNGPECKFMFPGSSDPYGYGVGGSITNPMPQPVWTEKSAGNTPADRRFLISAGPFTMESGEVTDVTIGVVWARANSGGATGSFGLLLKADDYAQNLFDNDFELANGPNAPNLAIAEEDQELIININPVEFLTTIGPKIPIQSTGVCTNEVLYKKNEKLVKTDNYEEYYNTRYYKFQGFLLYQVKNELIPNDYSDQNQVRLVAQCDLEDGITYLVNTSRDPLTGLVNNQLMVNGEDKGLSYSFKITKDLFASGNDRLVNYKDYYYLVKAYASNLDESRAAGVERMEYLESRLNIKTYKATPHKTVMENSGYTPGAVWGQGIEVKKIAGNGGNGGNFLKINDKTRELIFENTKHTEAEYEMANSPFQIKVIDVKNLVTSDFNLRFQSVIQLDNRINNKQFVAGDTLMVAAMPVLDGTNVANDPDKQRNYASGIKQLAGMAVIEEVIPSFNGLSTNYKVKMLNEAEGGRFTLLYDSLNKVENTAGTSYTFKKHLEMQLPVIKKGSFADTLYCTYFKINDSFVITDLESGRKFKPEYYVSRGEEMVIPDFGISIKTKNGNNPSIEMFNTGYVGFKGAEYKYKEPAKAWINENVATNKWIDNSATAKYDPNNKFIQMAAKGWAPYFYVNNLTSGGPAYANSKEFDAHVPNKDGQLNRLANVDIILTDDPSKWTEVVVLQADNQTSVSHPAFRMNKSLLPSVDKNGLPTGNISPKKHLGADSLSRGKSWFPGYAIDLDRGVRLNMMFSESKLRDAFNGNNLRWDVSTADSLSSYVYVLNSVYDRCEKVEYLFDSLRYENLNISQHQVRMNNAFASIQIMYVGNVTLKTRKASDPIFTRNMTETQISLRVEREFASDGTIQPEYFFSTKGLEPKKNQRNLAKDALDLIKVVPNPYYAYSEYEMNQLQNLVKITNLPQKCTIRIYTVNGTLIRTITKDNSLTYQEWNLQNQESIPVASGTYIVHINAPEIGEKIVKWMGVNRVLDLETF